MNVSLARFLLVLPAIVLMVESVQATHRPDCVPAQAHPDTVNVFPMPLGQPRYLEERDVPSPFATNPPPPFAGALLGNGTWLYQEFNGLAGLQRGGDTCSDPLNIFCVQDPVEDESCHHGPDILIWSDRLYWDEFP